MLSFLVGETSAEGQTSSDTNTRSRSPSDMVDEEDSEMENDINDFIRRAGAREYMYDMLSPYQREGRDRQPPDDGSPWRPWEMIQPPSMGESEDDEIDEITGNITSRETLVNIPEVGESSTDDLDSNDLDPQSDDFVQNTNNGQGKEFLTPTNSIPVVHNKHRKYRYSSSTSVDTSDTSGIGSLSDGSALGSLGDDIAHDIDKSPTSGSYPSSSRLDLGESIGELCTSIDHSDSEVNTPEEDIIDKPPRETVSMYMEQKVNQLPLPNPLKSFILHYRL